MHCEKMDCHKNVHVEENRERKKGIEGGRKAKCSPNQVYHYVLKQTKLEKRYNKIAQDRRDKGRPQRR